MSEGTAATFTLTRTAPYTDALTVNVSVSVSQTGEFIEMENSYQPPTEVTFIATEAMATLSVAGRGRVGGCGRSPGTRMRRAAASGA